MALNVRQKARIKFEDDMVEATQNGHIYKKIVLDIIEWCKENQEQEILQELEQVIEDVFNDYRPGGH